MKLVLTIFAILAAVIGVAELTSSGDRTKASVMITTRSLDHGGTGTILQSSNQGSYILTNAHVCEVVKDGGVVTANHQQYQVDAYQESPTNDLCMIYVQQNLHESTKISHRAPRLNADATAVGHPALMPTVISEGKFSEHSIINVIIGFKPCTAEDQADPLKGLLCAFLGGIPIERSYDSQLVSATIMPGSSGSAVYNTSNRLVGVVFAGQGDFGYAWTMPYQAVTRFLYRELRRDGWTYVDQSSVFGVKSEARNVDIYTAMNKCKTLRTIPNDEVARICNILKRDVVY
jgi:S1-C subfamily serine protease